MAPTDFCWATAKSSSIFMQQCGSKYKKLGFGDEEIILIMVSKPQTVWTNNDLENQL